MTPNPRPQGPFLSPRDGVRGSFFAYALSHWGRFKLTHFDQTKVSTFCREKYVQDLYTEVTIKLEVTYELDKDH